MTVSALNTGVGGGTAKAPSANAEGIVHELADRNPEHLEVSDEQEVERIVQDRNANRERFIPVSNQDILERMTAPGLWPDDEASVQAKRFFRYLAAWRHIVYSERLDMLIKSYQPFNPERDVVHGAGYTDDDRRQSKDTLIDLLTRVLEQANYRRIARDRINELVTKESVYNLDLSVDLDEYEDVVVFWRGATIKQRERRSLKKAYLGKVIETFPIYQRLFVLLKLKPEDVRIREIIAKEGCDEKQARKKHKKARRMLPPDVTSDYVYLKMFKDIPRSDLEMMFPNTVVRLRTSDKVWLGVMGGGGIGAGAVGVITKVMIASTNPIGFALAAAGFLGAAGRGVSNVLNQRRQYLMVLAQNLYFHSLADNSGAIALITRRAEEEDLKEEMLLYTMLCRAAVNRNEIGEAKAAIEQFLEDEFKVRIDFDILDALRRLKADKLVEETPDGMLRAIPLRDGIAHLDRLWDGYLDPNGQDRSLLTEQNSS